MLAPPVLGGNACRRTCAKSFVVLVIFIIRQGSWRGSDAEKKGRPQPPQTTGEVVGEHKQEPQRTRYCNAPPRSCVALWSQGTGATIVKTINTVMKLRRPSDAATNH